MHNALTSAIMTAARNAPPIEPMPPTTTTTKASAITVRSSRDWPARARPAARRRGRRGRSRARTPTVNSMAWLTPSAPTISRSWVAARISRPKRVLRQQQVQQQQYDRADGDQEQVVAREAAAEDLDRAAQAGRARAEQVLRSPDVLRDVVDDQHEREGGEQLEQLRRADRCGAAAGSRSARPKRRHRPAPAAMMPPQKPSAPPTLSGDGRRRDRGPACRTSRGRY